VGQCLQVCGQALDEIGFAFRMRNGERTGFCQGGIAMIVRTILVGLVALFIAGNGAARACQGKTGAALDDNFQKPDPGWGKLSGVYTTTPQGLLVQPVANGTSFIANTAYTSDGADYCVDLLIPAQMQTPANRITVGDAGLLFWLKDTSNFYVATIGPDGTVLIARYVNTSWSNLYGPTPNAAIKTAPGAMNEIELQVKGNAGTLIINDTTVTSFHGQAPPEGGLIGLYAESGNASVTPWVYPRVQLY